MPFIACLLCDKIKAVYKYYTGAKTMERQRFLPLLAVIIFIWVLWRYEAALALLLAEPLLIRRPLMEAAGRRLVGFEPAAVAAWLDSPALAELDGRRTEGCAANQTGRPCPAPET